MLLIANKDHGWRQKSPNARIWGSANNRRFVLYLGITELIPRQPRLLKPNRGCIFHPIWMLGLQGKPEMGSWWQKKIHLKVRQKPISLKASFRLDSASDHFLVSTDIFEFVLPSCKLVQKLLGAITPVYVLIILTSEFNFKKTITCKISVLLNSDHPCIWC